MAAATLLVFWQVHSFDFVDYDDSDYVRENTHVQGGLTLANVRWALTSGHASNWHPVTWLSHMLDYQLFGGKAGGHHMVNVALHVLNSVLLFGLLRRVTGFHGRSFMVAALFALHPLHVESVAWVSERKDVLSTFFGFLCLWCYAEYTLKLRPGPSGSAPPESVSAPGTRGSILAAPWPGWAWYALSLLLFAIGLMSKPMLVTLPFVLLLMDWWPLGRWKTSAGAGAALRCFIQKWPFILLSVASCVVTYIVQQKGGAVSASLTLVQRLANALVSYARYVGKLLWPQNLSVLYLHPGNWPLIAIIGAALLFAVLFAFAVLVARKRPYVTVGWLWFVGTLIPVIGVVQVGIQCMADRYAYLPSVGFFVALVWGVAEWATGWRWSREALALVSGAAVAGCGFLTVHQVGFWRDSEALFGNAVRVDPKNYLAYNNLGFYLSKKGRVEEALEYYRKSLEIKPSYEDALNNYGYALAGRRQFADALPYYEAALRVRPNHVEVHNNYGNALSEVGRIDEAIEHYRFVLGQKPDHADAHNNLGIALAMKGKLDEAIGHFEQAIRFKPSYASAHSNLGNAYAVQHKLEQATAQYLECLRLNPDDPQAHNNLGNVLTEQGKWDEAVRHYEEALRLNTNNPEAHFNLGIVLARLGKRDAAVAHYKEALRLRPDYGEARAELNRTQAGNP